MDTRTSQHYRIESFKVDPSIVPPLSLSYIECEYFQSGKEVFNLLAKVGLLGNTFAVFVPWIRPALFSGRDRDMQAKWLRSR